MTTFRVMLYITARHDYELHSLDFSTTNLQGSLHEQIWLPLDFFPSSADLPLFVQRGSTLFFVLVYIDELVFTTPNKHALASVKGKLRRRHTCIDLGELQRYLGLQITRDRAARTIMLTQSHMVEQILTRFRFPFSKVHVTPLAVDHGLTAPPSHKPFESSGPYPEMVGCLMYLMTCTRPNLAYPLSVLVQFVAPGRHRPSHWYVAKRVAKYVASTSGMGLVLGGKQPVTLTCYSGSSWADDAESMRSTQGYCFSLGTSAVSWRSTQALSVSSSTCEAEVYDAAMAAQELRWLSFLLTDLGERPRSPPVLFANNSSKARPAWYVLSLRPTLQISSPRRCRLDVTFDKSVCFYRLFSHSTPPIPPPSPPLSSCFLGPAPSGVSQVDPPPFVEPLEVSSDTSGPAEGGDPAADDIAATYSGVAGPGGADYGGAGSGGVESGGAGLGLREWVIWRGRSGGRAGAAGPGGAGAGGAGVSGGGGAGVGGAGGTGAVGAGGAGAGDAGAGGIGAGGAGGAGAGGAGARGTEAIGAGGAGAGGASAGGPGAGGAVTEGTGAGGSGTMGTAQRRLFFLPQPRSSLPPPDSALRKVLSLPSSTGLTPPLLCPPPDKSQPQLQPDSPLPAPSPYTGHTVSLTERCEPVSRRALPVRAVCRAHCVRPPPVPGTYIMALRPSSVPQRISLPSPLASSLPHVPDPESDLACAASPTVTWVLATIVTDPSFVSTAVSALVTELCLATAVTHLSSMLLCPKGYPDALDIPTPRSYAEAISVQYSSQWQTAMDIEMACWKTTGIYVDAVPPHKANVVDGMWILRVKRPPGSPPSFKARYIARGSSASRVARHTEDYTCGSWFALSSVDPSLFLRTDPSLLLFYIHIYVLMCFGFHFSSPKATLSTGHSPSAPPLDESVEPSGQFPELVGCLMSTRSSSILSSSCKAEIYAGAMAAQELHWLTYLL
ncbi:unnamed protein product [Closterium sp. NIES-53]